jgi:hypothetical protein
MQSIVIGSEAAREEGIQILRDLDVKRAHKMDVKLYRDGRSNNQNNLFQVWMKLLAEATGNSRKYMATFFEEEFLESHFITIAGTSHEVHGEAKSLNTEEFSIFMDEVHAWVADNMPDVRLPLPDDNYHSSQMEDALRWD